MREQRYGRILNTCSAAGILGAQGMSNYGAAKTGLIGFTRVLAAEGAGRNIKVNAIAPIRLHADAGHSVDGAGRPDYAAAFAVLNDLVGQYLQKLELALVAPWWPS
jgi:NAD(P)-dependent dehydrogenase (short-subunit alcohol dehydrogenase family)